MLFTSVWVWNSKSLNESWFLPKPSQESSPAHNLTQEFKTALNSHTAQCPLPLSPPKLCLIFHASIKVIFSFLVLKGDKDNVNLRSLKSLQKYQAFPKAQFMPLVTIMANIFRQKTLSTKFMQERSTAVILECYFVTRHFHRIVPTNVNLTVRTGISI